MVQLFVQEGPQVFPVIKDCRLGFGCGNDIGFVWATFKDFAFEIQWLGALGTGVEGAKENSQDTIENFGTDSSGMH